MTKYNKPLIAMLLSAVTVMGAAGIAEARGHGWGHGGGPRGGCYGAGYAQDVTPEQAQLMEKAYNDIAPLQMELRAKQAELTAKIYGGADDKTVQALSSEVAALQNKVTQARVTMQQNFAKAGVPLHHGRGCWFGGGNGRGHGPGYGAGYGPHHGYGPGYGPGNGPGRDGSGPRP